MSNRLQRRWQTGTVMLVAKPKCYSIYRKVFSRLLNIVNEVLFTQCWLSVSSIQTVGAVQWKALPAQTVLEVGLQSREDRRRWAGCPDWMWQRRLDGAAVWRILYVSVANLLSMHWPTGNQCS